MTTYDPRLLKSPAEARNYMRNAREGGRMDLYWVAFRRLCALEGRNHEDPLVVDFWRVVAAVEELLTAKNGRTTRASRTRQKADRVGEVQCLADWASDNKETEGFRLLVEAGLADHTGEYIVLKHAARFAPDVVSAAKRRLEAHGVDAQLSASP